MSQPPTGRSAVAPGSELAADGLSTTRTSPSNNRSTTTRSRIRLLRTAGLPTAAPLLLVSGAAVGAFSVSAYHRRVVLSYLVLVVVLGVTAWRGLRRPLPLPSPAVARLAGSLALLAAGVLTWTVPAFSYVSGDPAVALRGLGAGTAVAAAAVLALPWRPAPTLALTIAAAGYAACCAAALRLDPAPRIDVWYTLQGAADGLLHGQDLYRQVWIGPPGPMPFFTDRPWTAVLLAPGRWLGGDVRWALAVVTISIAVMLRALPRRTAPAAGATAQALIATTSAALVLLLPGTLTQVEQAWTEPLLLGCLTLAVLGLVRGHGWLAVLGVALACASKQHVLLLLPVLAAWPRFGVRRTLVAGLLAGGLVLPWFLVDPAAMWHDTVTLLVNFPPLRFADTLYIAVLNEWGVQPPFWLTGATVATVVGTAVVVVRRHDPPVAVVLRWCALVLFVANLVNKQAFYNQYWLVAGLVLLSWAAVEPASAPASAGDDTAAQGDALPGPAQGPAAVAS